MANLTGNVDTVILNGEIQALPYDIRSRLVRDDCLPHE